MVVPFVNKESFMHAGRVVPKFGTRGGTIAVQMSYQF